ncbi:diiron oxygenase [Streptomyces sp. NPDC101110]|uniref:diiron oxygenase n=1 Tax=unclassified Streptomyces TaxID=2593676 RepID=UPI003813218E
MIPALKDWYENAGVRSRERRILAEDREEGLLLFPEKLVPYLDHDALAHLGADARRALLAQHFYQYMQYTTQLETQVVNRGTALVAHGQVDMPLSAQARLDAFKIYCDEGYHALFSLDLLQQIEKAVGIPALPYDFGPRMARLEQAAERFLPGCGSLGHILQVVSFETVVTSLLSEIPRDPTVYRAVRAVVDDHVSDEVHHHAYFARFFKELWAGLSPARRVDVACAMPHFVHACLVPEPAPVRAALVSVGVSTSDADAVLRDHYGEAALSEAVNEAGRHTLRLCQAVGAFDLPQAQEQLQLLNLRI